MKNKARIILQLELDTDEYHVPADLNLKEQLKDDLIEAIESLSINVEEIIVKVQGTHVAEATEDYN